jgi:hypothetical protein
MIAATGRTSRIRYSRRSVKSLLKRIQDTRFRIKSLTYRDIQILNRRAVELSSKSIAAA